MYKKHSSGFILFLVLTFLGCATTIPYVWKSRPAKQEVSNDYFDAKLSPICSSWGCKAFLLSLENKTNKNLEFNWNKTLYIRKGQTSGSFMFEGVVYKDRNNSKPPDIIFANSKLLKTIWPNNLVYFSNYGWGHESMGAGENGVYLSVIVNGKEVNEQLKLNLYQQLIGTNNIGTQKSTYSESKSEYTDWIGLTVKNTYNGVQVITVNQDGPAYTKIIEGDIIKEVNRKPVRSIDDYKYIFERMETSTVLFLVTRNGKGYFVTVDSR